MSKKTPAYCLHKASGKAVVRLNGKDVCLGTHGTKESKQAYARLIAEWVAGGRGTSYGLEQEQTTIAILLCNYYDFCDSHYPKTNANEAEQTRCACRFLDDYHDLPAADFGPLRLKAVRQAMLDHVGKHDRKLSRSYVNKSIDRIRRMFRWAVENEMVEAKVYQALKAVKGLQLGRTTAPESPKIKPVADVAVKRQSSIARRW